MKTLAKILLSGVLLGNAGIAQAAPLHRVVAAHGFETEDRHLSGFNAIEASSFFDVVLTQGGSESVRVEAPADIMRRIETVVEGGVLKLRTRRENGSWSWNWNNHNERVTVYVSIREVNRIGLSGSGSVTFTNGIKANNLELSVSGSGDIKGRVEAETLQSRVSGSGDMKLNGHVNTSTVSVSGSGDYAAASLATSETSVRVSGSGSARVNAGVRIDAVASGSGDVYYSGNARQVSVTKHGSGDVHRVSDGE